jgi:hypothetical protein
MGASSGEEHRIDNLEVEVLDLLEHLDLFKTEFNSFERNFQYGLSISMHCNGVVNHFHRPG